MLKKNIILSILFILTLTVVKAGWMHPPPSRAGSGSSGCNSFTTSSPLHTWDDAFQSTIYNGSSIDQRDDYYDRNIINRITLGIDRTCIGPFSGFTANQPYTLEVDILIEYLDYNKTISWIQGGNNLGGTCTGSNCTKNSFALKTLQVRYDPSYKTNETELSTFSFEGGYDVKVTIQAIRTIYGGNLYNTAPNNAYIENIISIERFRNLDVTATPTLSFNVGPNLSPPVLTNGEAQIEINTPVPGAESYDIEWLFLDWQTGYEQTAGVQRFHYSFRNNASRITVKNLAYKLPVVYPKGILLFRVRANGVYWSDPNNKHINTDKTTDWLGSESATVDCISGTLVPYSFGITPIIYGFYFSGFNPDLTWQHSVSFAEDGKKKQVISYYDGSLYNRQSITKNNTTEKAVVGQTVYDFNGRPAIQILPSPVPSTDIQVHDLTYKANYNQTNAPARVEETYNYEDFDIEDTLTCSLLKTSRLDDGSGTEKYYSANNPLTSENSSRIPKAQGYPFTQTEFEPDNTGRVRRQSGVGPAHRLTGADETGANQNGNETKYYYGVPSQTELDRLFGNEVGKAVRYKKNVVIDPNGQASVSYIDPMGRVIATALAGNPTNSPNMLPVAGRNPTTVTWDIVERDNKINMVDLTITSEADFVVYNDNTTEQFQYRLAIPMLTYVCGTDEFCFDCKYNLQLSVTDECGTEYIPSQYQNNYVGISESPGHTCGDSIIFSTSGYFDVVLNKGEYKVTRKLTLDKTAIEEYIQEILAGAGPTCIKSYEDLVIEEKAKLDYGNCDYTCQKCIADGYTTEQCEIFCKEFTPCDALYQHMIADMSPGGQYFDNIVKGDVEARMANGQLDNIISDPPDNTWLENADDNYPNILTTISGIAGHSITNWSEVRKHWRPEFAEELIIMHPEHCYYLACDDEMVNSYKYDEAMRRTTTASAALTAGYYNPTGMTVTSPFTIVNTTNNDPFFIGGIGATYQGTFENGLNNYTNNPTRNVWEYVDYTAGELGSDIQGCLSDWGWGMFRAIYLQEKHEKIVEYYNAQCPTVTVNANYDKRFILDPLDADLFADNGVTLPNFGSTNEPDYINTVNANIATHCNEACSAYIDHWKTSLAKCFANTQINNNQTIIDAIIADLLAVCKGGCDAENPLGSREMSPSVVTTGPRSFKEVLEQYYSAGVCDELLIDWPMGYDHDYWAQLSPDANKCACEADKYIRDIKCKTIGTASGSCKCAGTDEVEQTIVGDNITDEHKCKNCIDCYAINKELKDFFIQYDHEMANTDPLTFRHIIKNYLNIKFSMNLTYEDYFLLAAECLYENETQRDINTFHRLSLFNYYYRPAIEFEASFTSNYHYEVSPLSVEFKFAKASDPERYNKRYIVSNSDKSTWLASTNYEPHFRSSAYKGNSIAKQVAEEKTLPDNDIIDIIYSPTSMQCNCTEILRADALYKMGQIKASSSQMAYQVLHGYTYSDYEDRLRECCHYLNGTGGPDMACDLSPVQANTLLNNLRTGIQPTYSGAYSTYSTYPTIRSFDDAPCPPDETECLTQKVTLDKCGCDNLMALKLKLGQTWDDVENDPINYPHPPDAETYIRNFIEKELGLPLNSLPSDFNPRQLTTKCEEFYQTGAGDDDNGNPNPITWSSTPLSPPQFPVWEQSGLDDLNETAGDEGIEIPRILSCHPYCDRVPPKPGGGGPVPPATILPEPLKCKSPTCQELVNLYKEFLDSVGIPYSPPGNSLLPAELQDELTLTKTILDYNKDKANATFPTISAWSSYFPGLTTQQIFAQINASITTKLVADGYCHIESERPFKEQGETYDYFLNLLMCLQPIKFKQTPCSACYTDGEILLDVQAWLNQLAKDQKNILNKNKKNYQQGNSATWIDKFYNELYGGSAPTTLKQFVWTSMMPFLNLEINDGVGSTNEVFDITLIFTDPMLHKKYNWRYVKSFSQIQYLLDENCEPTDMFKIKAYIEIPPEPKKTHPACPGPNPCYETVWLTGRISTPANIFVNDYQVVTCPPCSTLCNKPILPVVEPPDVCTEFLDRVAEGNASTRYKKQIEDLRQDFTEKYLAKCMSAFDAFNRKYTLDEYHFTLYYYDQADNLIKTVPPKGVVTLSQTSIDSVVSHRTTPYPNGIRPNHNYITNYKYNTLNQLTEQTTPDAGVSKFWYDRLGRIVLSQNAKQAAFTGTSGEKIYSYTLYDNLGRITEAGEITLTSAIAAAVTPENTADISWIDAQIVACTTKTQITRTVYDKRYSWMPTIAGFTQTNLRNRVVGTFYYETYPLNTSSVLDYSLYSHATWYSYDVLGNVHHLVQDFAALAGLDQRYKHIEYSYELASGNVNLVSYQRGKPDQMFHHYKYDADNRITDVYTSRNPGVDEIDFARSGAPEFIPGMGWQRDAKYFYYLHGPLERAELGQNQVQGTDYSYTLHGWLKTVNSGLMQDIRDPGKDGHIPGSGGNANRWVARDIIGLELGYYRSNATVPYDDYTAILDNAHISTKTSSDLLDHMVDLYNGNINHTVTTLPNKTQFTASNTLQAAPLGTVYRYDQLNRLISSNNYTNANTSGNSWQNTIAAGIVTQPWEMKLSYDPMGNIKTLVRHAADGSSVLMDSLTYTYNDAGWTNQLTHVDDGVTNTAAHTEDIDDQNANNYTYDQIGNMITDAAEQIASIEWTVYGKIKKITRTGGSAKPNLEFEYNTAGQRVIKRVLPNNGDKPTATYYVRDASGNILTTYQHYYEVLDPNYPTVVKEWLVADEVNLYGSSRLGVWYAQTPVASRNGTYSGGTFTPSGSAALTTLVTEQTELRVGLKVYELTNHLGNVLATVTDRKVPVVSGSAYSYFNPQLTTFTDYYPFGQQIEERSYTAPVTGCQTVDNIVNLPSTTTHYNFTFTILSQLNMNETFTIDDGNGNLTPIGFYVFGYSTTDYAAQVTAQLNTMPGVTATQNGSSVDVTVDVNASDFNCDEVITLMAAFSPFYSTTVYCAPNTVNYPYQVCTPGSYRFGYNGKEMDNEVSGTGNQYDYGFRIYNPRIGKFLSVDPLFKSYPYYTPYQFAGNTPIAAIDLDGLEQAISTGIPVWLTTIFFKEHNRGYNMASEVVEEGMAKTGDFIINKSYKLSTYRDIFKSIYSQPINNGLVTVGYLPSEFTISTIKDFNDQVVNGDAESQYKYFLKAFFGVATAKATSVTLRYGAYGLKGLSLDLKKTYRGNLAEDFYKKAGYRDISSHTDNINTELPVFTKTLTNSEKSTVVLYQYRLKDGSAGSYYVNSTDITPEQVGLLSSDYVEVWKATLKDGVSIKTLNSTHISNAKYWRDGITPVEGGGQQIFSPELKDNVIWEQIK